MNYTVIPERLAEVMAASLKSGSHTSGKKAMCVMEAVSYVAGETWTDSPQCACPVISSFLRSWNDAIRGNERDELLKDLIPRLVGTRSTKAVENRRGTMAADWLIRVHTPAWLRLAKLDAQAAQIEALPEITDFAHCPSLMPTLKAVRSDAVGARFAASDAAEFAAGAALAWDAAGAAAWDAASTAVSDTASDTTAWAAASDHAGRAAWAAASAASWDAIKETRASLQASAKALVIRMIEVTP